MIYVVMVSGRYYGDYDNFDGEYSGIEHKRYVKAYREMQIAILDMKQRYNLETFCTWIEERN